MSCLAASYCSPVERKPSFSPSAIVIGSGFAGLAAAHALQNASFKVKSLEAQLVNLELMCNYTLLKML